MNHPFGTNALVALTQISEELGLSPRTCPHDIVMAVRELNQRVATHERPEVGTPAPADSSTDHNGTQRRGAAD